MFTGQTGNWDLELGYFDENDGAASMAVLLSVNEIDSWVWNQNLGTAFAAREAQTTRSVDGVTLNIGDTIEI